MTAHKILVPYNFAAFDQKALDFLIRNYAGREEIEITLFNAFTPLPDIDTQDSPAVERLKQSLSYLASRIREQEEALESVRQDLVAGGFRDNQVLTRYESRRKDVPGQILETAANGGFHTIVLSREPRKMRRFFTASVFQKVIEGAKDMAVCVVS